MSAAIATGLCRCGCGQRTSMAKQTTTRLGHIKGEPVPYVNGSHARWARDKQSAESRFWSKVAKSDGCWLWTGSKTEDGYGTFGNSTNQTVRAHRFSWTLANGPIPDGQGVLHRCDSPACVRPDHLFLGTHVDNMRDMYSKGRRKAAVGERHGLSKLTEERVLDIRRRCAAGEPYGSIARRHNVDKRTVIDIFGRATWKHVGGPA